MCDRLDFEELDWAGDSQNELQIFCMKAGLPTGGIPWGDIVKIYALRDCEGKLEATARIEIIYDHPFVESVAVREDLRGKGLGKMIVYHAISKARDLGYDKIWAVARVPDFYKKLGFVEETEHGLKASLQEDCMKCDQYLKECFPMLMRKDID